MKACSLCGDSKPFEAFSKCAGQADGMQRYCKDCQKKKKREWDTENRIHKAAYSKEWGIKNPEKLKAMQARNLQSSTKKFPEKRKARIAVSNAIRDGRLQKQPCWVCGKNAQAHHVCYDEPLMVSWLCKTHHNEAHAMAL